MCLQLATVDKDFSWPVVTYYDTAVQPEPDRPASLLNVLHNSTEVFQPLFAQYLNTLPRDLVKLKRTHGHNPQEVDFFHFGQKQPEEGPGRLKAPRMSCQRDQKIAGICKQTRLHDPHCQDIELVMPEELFRNGP